MNEEREIGITEAIEPESIELDTAEFDSYYSYPTCHPANTGGTYYGNPPYHYDMYYGVNPAVAHNWQTPLQSWGWYPGWPGGIAQIPSPPTVCSGFYYTIRSGETLWNLTRRFGVSITAILRANPQITDPNMIYAGQIICIPFPPPPMPCSGFLYTIRAGDSLFSIARRFGISMSALSRANPQIVNPNIIYPGQVICIPFPRPPAVCRGFLYTVMSGDTIARIGRRFGVRPGDILRANPQIVNPDLIFAGQTICIPFPPPPDCPDGFLYTIQRGDTLFAVARRNNITLDALLSANPQIIEPDSIFVGQVICIPRQTAGEIESVPE